MALSHTTRQPVFKNLPLAQIVGGCFLLVGCGICLTTIMVFSFSARSPLQGNHNDPQISLNQAKRDLDNKQPQKVLDSLKPDEFSKVDEQALAYEYLGQAEIQLGHFQFAAMYFENMYALQPTAAHLYMLATAYDAGGDLRNAIKKYKMLAALSTPDANTYRSLVESRITQLEEILKIEPTSYP